MKQRAFLAIGTIVLCAGLLAGCGKITKSVEINYGETYKIEDEKLEGKENLTWESADAEIVEVADDGTVTAKAPGKAKVAIKENGKSVGEYTFNVSIVPIEQIIFSSDTIEVTDGDTVAVKYTLLPQNASDYGITWTSADETIVKVRNVDEVKLIAQSEGKTTIIATTDNGVTAQCAVEVDLGIGIAESCVFHLRFDIVQSQSMGKRDVNIAGFHGQLFLSGLRKLRSLP